MHWFGGSGRLENEIGWQDINMYAISRFKLYTSVVYEIDSLQTIILNFLVS